MYVTDLKDLPNDLSRLKKAQAHHTIHVEWFCDGKSHTRELNLDMFYVKDDKLILRVVPE